MNCSDGQWAAKVVEIPKDSRAVYKAGEIRDGDSFYSAGMRAGIPTGVLADVFDLLAFEIDFERDVRAGQAFSVLYEEHYNDGEKVSNGAILAVSFDALRGNVKMYRFKKPGGAAGYYDENGNGAIKSLKRTPINNAKISSSFSMNRKHPVLGFTRAHKGVDFRAATGTPIPAAGGGRIIEKKYGNGWGNYITIQHNKTYSTRYAHMSKFQKGVNVGTTVRQGQIIGFVGATGIATGPHLHYEILQNGVHVNPMTVKLPAIDSLAEKDKPKFAEVRDAIESAKEALSKEPSLFVQM
jgi:murein DD-endopeptidase MepM/ murein hydrolase activator NlpD